MFCKKRIQFGKGNGMMLKASIKLLHADNGRFKSKAFLMNIKENKKTIGLSGVGAYHQDDVAEKGIGDHQLPIMYLQDTVCMCTKS